MLPEIKLECRNGHRFGTRAKADQSIPCQVCGVSVWISKYARGRPVGSGRPQRQGMMARSVPSRMQARPAVSRRVVEDQAGEDDVLPRMQPAAPAARMLGDLVRMVQHRQQHGRIAPDGEVLTGTVIPPDRSPVVRDPTAPAQPAAPDLDGKQPLRAGPKLPKAAKSQPEHGFGQHLVPRDAKLAPPCGGCRSEARRSPVWTRAAWQVELTAAAVAAGLPGVLELCGNHVRQVPGELVAVRRRWEPGGPARRTGWVLAREPATGTAPKVPAPVARPNPTIVLSGGYG